jgi:hypothetical protein
MEELIKTLTYSRGYLEKLSYGMLCDLNNITSSFARINSLTKDNLIEFLLIPNN